MAEKWEDRYGRKDNMNLQYLINIRIKVISEMQRIIDLDKQKHV